MALRTHPLLIAVDGGGTRCRLVLDGAEGRHVAERGSANVSSDFDAAVAEIRAGLTELAHAAGLSMPALSAAPAYLGLAGVTDAALAGRVVAALGLDRARVEDDRPAALRGALGSADGAVAHCGTGSFFALQSDGKVRLAGGWGAVLGDEASAYWVARNALTAVLACADGLDEFSDLTRALLTRFSSPSRIVAFAAQASPSDIADLAPLVTEAAEAGDATASRILQAGADHIAEVLAKMGWQPGMALCLTGGLGPSYRGYLPSDLAAALAAPKAAPIDGALDLARDFAAESVP